VKLKRFTGFRNDMNQFSKAYRHVVLSYIQIITIAVTTTLTSSAFAIDLFISENGDDTRDGRTLKDSLATLKKALDIAMTSADPSGNRILIAPGKYSGQTTNIKIKRSTSSVSVERLEPEIAPVFDGESVSGTWLRIKSTVSQPLHLRLTIKGLKVRRYRTAISIEGETKSEGGELKAVAIISNVFEEIGTLDDHQPSTAAIRFVNVQKSRIAGNLFQKIQNVHDCKLLHPIYLAHNSTDNLIQYNTFDQNCGHAIKLRNSSNNNIITSNRFTNQTLPKYVQDWYCDSTKRIDCIRGNECPSWNNRFAENLGPRGNVAGADVLDILDSKEISLSCRVPENHTRFIIK
jgi:hypothetical protein